MQGVDYLSFFSPLTTDEQLATTTARARAHAPPLPRTRPPASALAQSSCLVTLLLLHARTRPLSLFSLSLLHTHTHTHNARRAHTTTTTTTTPSCTWHFWGALGLCRACLSAVVVASSSLQVCLRSLAAAHVHLCAARATLDPISPLHSLRTKTTTTTTTTTTAHVTIIIIVITHMTTEALVPRGAQRFLLNAVFSSPTPPSLFCDLAFGMATAAAAEAGGRCAARARSHTHATRSAHRLGNRCRHTTAAAAIT
jgi:hypothetical protein